MEYYTQYSANIHRGLYHSQQASDAYDQSRQVVLISSTLGQMKLFLLPGLLPQLI